MNNKVLLVDDQTEVVEGLARLMANEFEITTAGSSAEALKACEENGPFAVVVSDHQMPGGDGVDLLARVRDDWPTTVRILMTGHADLETAMRATNDGEVFRFLEKPLPHRILWNALDEGLSRHERAEVERRLSTELRSTRDSVGRLATALEGGFNERVSLVHEISHLASQLSTTDDLTGIAQISSHTASTIFPGRGIILKLSCSGEEEVTESAGPQPEGTVHRESVGTSEGEVGHFLIANEDRRGEKLSEGDFELLRAIASFTGVAVANQIRRRERDDAQHSVVFAMARLAETRDNETGKHIERVSSYCALAADALMGIQGYEEIDQKFIEDLIRSAPLHDIGKVGIPDAILLKPGRLDAEEWAIMQKHAALGADILRQVIAESAAPGFLLMARDIAWCHHEKWDGSGYPRGLKGTEIPLSARILSVADCFDALTSRRPYKEPWSREQSVGYLQEHSGTQFDPQVIEAFLSREDQAREIMTRLADELQ